MMVYCLKLIASLGFQNQTNRIRYVEAYECMTVLVMEGFEPLNRVVGVSPLLTLDLLSDAVVDAFKHRLTNLAKIALGRINKATLRVGVEVVLMLWPLSEIKASVFVI